MRLVKNLFLTTFILGTAVSLNAQHIKRCASHEYLMAQEKQTPGRLDFVKSLNNLPSKKTRGTLNIPVVVHVVYKNATENISDARINAQIAMLNACFRRKNLDTTKTRTIFKPIVGGMDIQFWLVDIKRVATTQSSFVFDFDIWGNNQADQVKEATYGSVAVQPDKKLNIWVCDLGLPSGMGELLGYAYPPPGLNNWPAGSAYPSQPLDGVVIDYLAFGGNGLNAQPLGSAYGLKGKTCVHEVGHYLGLRHIWGDDNGLCPGAGGEDDGVNDTPAQGDMSNNNCDTLQNTCMTANDMPDMIENYMDYSAETCQNSFTKQQVTMMQNVLDNFRTGIRIPTGIEMPDYSTDLAFYPNPVENTLHVYTDREDLLGADLILLNHVGQIVYKGQIKQLGDNAIQLQGMAKGLYFAQVLLNQQSISSQKIILK